jgi:hypothetical protein
VDLNGQQPWSGVRCICRRCLDWLSHVHAKVTAP